MCTGDAGPEQSLVLCVIICTMDFKQLGHINIYTRIDVLYLIWYFIWMISIGHFISYESWDISFLKKVFPLNINGALLVSFWLQVFFCVLVGTFSIGNITPHVTTVAGAKGAAAVLIDIIDNVSTWTGPEKFVRETGNLNCLGQFHQIPWNQTTNVHWGSSLITWVITWR